MTPLIKKLIIGAAIIIGIFVIYNFFAGDQEAPLTSTAPTQTTAVEGDLLSLLLELRSISLSTDLLQDPAFTTLQDFTVTISPEPVGRQNPFAVVGAAAEVPVVEETEPEDEGAAN